MAQLARSTLRPSQFLIQVSDTRRNLRGDLLRLGLTDYVETLTVDCYVIVISVLIFD
jgi:hypothetical protein